MTKLRRFHVVYEEEASEFIVAQGKRGRRKLLDIGYAIAESPLADPDYVLPDADGRPLCHVETEGYVFTYWIDAAVKRL